MEIIERVVCTHRIQNTINPIVKFGFNMLDKGPRKVSEAKFLSRNYKQVLDLVLKNGILLVFVRIC